jgi:hypothetical protein
MKHAGVSLKHCQEATLWSGARLDDEIIAVIQNMLKQKHPAVGGLQSRSFGQKFAMEPQVGGFVQVLNVSNNHWITISTIGCEAFAGKVCDSLHGYLPSRTPRLVADLMQSQDRAIKVQYCDVQWQSGGSDCGLFALAFATSLCSGIQQPLATIRGR